MKTFWIAFGTPQDTAVASVVVVDVTEQMYAEAEADILKQGTKPMEHPFHTLAVTVAAAVHYAREHHLFPADFSMAGIMDVTGTKWAEVLPRDTLLTRAEIEAIGGPAPRLH